MEYRKNQDCQRSGNDARPARQPWTRQCARALACLAAAVILAGAAQPGQQPQATPASPDHQSPLPQVQDLTGVNTQAKGADDKTGQKNMVAATVEHASSTVQGKQIADDSAMLLKLATALKAEVDKTNKDTLSLTVIRKAEEIERLAHNVREKMKPTTGAN